MQLKNKRTSKLFKFIVFGLLFALLLILLLFIINQRQEQKTQQEIRTAKQKRKENALPHFKKLEDDSNDDRNYNVSDKTAISTVTPAIKFVLASMTKTNTVAQQEISQDKLTKSDQDKLGKYFRDFDSYQTVVMIVNYSTLNGSSVNSNNKQIKVPKVGTKYILDKNFVKQTANDNITYTYRDTLTYHANKFKSKTVNMLITVDKQTGLITDAESDD